MIDLLQLECLTGLEEAKKLAENPIVQVRKERYALVTCVAGIWNFSGRFARIVSSRTGCGVS